MHRGGKWRLKGHPWVLTPLSCAQLVSGFLHDTGVPHLEADISFKGTQEGMDVWEGVIWYKDVTVARIYGCGTESPSAPIGPEAP
ncbi:hypothetical protein DFH06DRAFT_1188661 [Mycena polygramma]|nr:hypothetical protein DFH06DRAFT_1188661 [Mycena polygramma]